MLCRFRFALEKEKGNMNLQGQEKIAKMTYCNHSIFAGIFISFMFKQKVLYLFSFSYRADNHKLHIS